MSQTSWDTSFSMKPPQTFFSHTSILFYSWSHNTNVSHFLFLFFFIWWSLIFIFSTLPRNKFLFHQKLIFPPSRGNIFHQIKWEWQFIGDLVGTWSSKFHYWKFISRINFKYKLSFSILEVITMEIGLGYALNILYTSGYLVKPLP